MLSTCIDANLTSESTCGERWLTCHRAGIQVIQKNPTYLNPELKTLCNIDELNFLQTEVQGYVIVYSVT